MIHKGSYGRVVRDSLFVRNSKLNCVGVYIAIL